MVLDLFAETFDVDVDGPRIPDVFIPPYAVQELFPCKDLVRRGSETVEKFQLLWGHIHIFPVADDRIVGEVDGDAVVLDTFCLFLSLRLCLDRLIAP